MQKGFVPVVFIILALVLITGGVAGYIILSKPKFPVYAPPLPATTSDQTSKVSSDDETANPDSIEANWKIYTNNEWQVSFSYPAGWSIKPFGNDPNNPNYIELNVNSVPYMSVSYIENPKNLTLQQIDQENAKNDKERGTGVNTPAVAPTNYTTIRTQNGYSAYYEKEYLCEPSVCERYTIVSPNKIIQIMIFSRTKELKDYSKIIEQMLSTFKFLE